MFLNAAALHHLQGGGFSWLFPFKDGAPPLGWAEASAYLVLPVLLVVSQYVSQAIISPTSTQDQSQQSSQAFLKFLPLILGEPSHPSAAEPATVCHTLVLLFYMLERCLLAFLSWSRSCVASVMLCHTPSSVQGFTASQHDQESFAVNWPMSRISLCSLDIPRFICVSMPNASAKKRRLDQSKLRSNIEGKSRQDQGPVASYSSGKGGDDDSATAMPAEGTKPHAALICMGSAMLPTPQ